MTRLWLAYLMRHGPYLVHLVFSNEKASTHSFINPSLHPCIHSFIEHVQTYMHVQTSTDLLQVPKCTTYRFKQCASFMRDNLKHIISHLLVRHNQWRN